jgi:hypothetical protein
MSPVTGPEKLVVAARAVGVTDPLMLEAIRRTPRDAGDYVSRGRWVIWAFQVMPVLIPCRRVRPCPVMDGASGARGVLDLVGA